MNTGSSIFNQHLPAIEVDAKLWLRRCSLEFAPGLEGRGAEGEGGEGGATGCGSGLAYKRQPAPVEGADSEKDAFQEVEPQNQAGSLVSFLGFHSQ